MNEGRSPSRRPDKNSNQRRGPGRATQGNKGPNSNSRPGRSRYRRKKKGLSGQLEGTELNFFRYLNLLEQHLHARRKYFELFHRADERQKDKLERKFSETMQKVNGFLDTLPPEEQRALEARRYARRDDTTYSQNQNVSPAPDVDLSNVEVIDPHFLEEQRKADFSRDTEESVGSYEDYKNYKGITD